MGIGVTYTSALDELILENPDIFEVLEIEPQTIWMETRKEQQPFRVLNNVLEKIAKLPGKKLVHSIGAPVGGTVLPDARQFSLLRETIELLKSPYASEHLSFNASHVIRKLSPYLVIINPCSAGETICHHCYLDNPGY